MMSPINHIKSLISQCNDLGLVIEVHEVLRKLVRSTEVTLFQEQLEQAQEHLTNAKLESEKTSIEAVTSQKSAQRNIDKIRESQKRLEESIMILERQLNLNSKKIVEERSDEHRLLIRHIGIVFSEVECWTSLPKQVLAAITSFLDPATIRACSTICKIWRHDLQFSDVYWNRLKQRLMRLQPRKTTEASRADHRIAIRIYLGEDSNSSNSIAFDKSLAQLQRENERVAAEYDATVSDLGKAEKLLSELQNDIKSTRQRLGVLRLARSDQINELRDLANRKKMLVSQTADVDRELANRRFQNVEAFLQLQEEMQLQIAESRRLDAVDRELNRLKQAVRVPASESS